MFMCMCMYDNEHSDMVRCNNIGRDKTHDKRQHVSEGSARYETDHSLRDYKKTMRLGQESDCLKQKGYTYVFKREVRAELSACGLLLESRHDGLDGVEGRVFLSLHETR